MAGYTLQVKQRLALIQFLARALCGDAHLSLEGDLSQGRTDLLAVPGASTVATSILPRNTLDAGGQVHDFIIVPLEINTVEILAQRILPRLDVSRCVWHIGIERHGLPCFVAYDCFSSTLLADDALRVEQLEMLVQQQVLRGYVREVR